MTLTVGFITPDLTMRHGWAQYSLSLLRALSQRDDITLHIITARSSPPLPELPAHPILPDLVPRQRFFLPALLPQRAAVHRLLQSCDLIHVTAEPYAPLGAWIAADRPLLITAHGSYVHLPQRESHLARHLYRRAFQRATLVCVSRYTARIAARVTPGVKTVVVPNGVETSRFTALEHTPQSPPLILSVGALKRRKGQLELVRALPAVRQQFPHLQAVLVGSTTAEPAYTARIEQTIRELGLQDIVHLAGHVPDAALLDYYRKATLFVLPSMNEGWKFEGSGLVHLEASAAALPVIGTRDCGAEDAIDDHHTGLLVSQSAIAAELPRAIITLLTDPAQAAAMGAAGRARALRQTWSHVAAQMHDVYNQHRS